MVDCFKEKKINPALTAIKFVARYAVCWQNVDETT